MARSRAWLEPALRRGRHADAPWAALEAEAAALTVQVWPGERSALLTRLLRTPEGGCCHVWLGGGALDELLQLRAGVEAWARAQGCTFATIDGRRGWARVFRAAGYRQAGDLLRKELA